MFIISYLETSVYNYKIYCIFKSPLLSTDLRPLWSVSGVLPLCTWLLRVKLSFCRQYSKVQSPPSTPAHQVKKPAFLATKPPWVLACWGPCWAQVLEERLLGHQLGRLSWCGLAGWGTAPEEPSLRLRFRFPRKHVSAQLLPVSTLACLSCVSGIAGKDSIY